MAEQKNLVIVESPAKAKTIEKFLGKDYKVMSSFGHIRDLKKKNFGVDLKTFAPQYEIPEDKKHVVSELRTAAKKADTVWLASDEDREGEAISWHLAEVLKIDPAQANRIVFHEITKPAILAAIESPRHIDLNLVDAQQARRVLDRLVGFKLSPVLWHKIRPNLSAGRVQSVAVRLIVERERAIQNFKPDAAYHVAALFDIPTDSGTATLKATLRKTFATKAEAGQFLADCRDAEFKIGSITTKPTKRTPAPPFTTSTLQQEAARKLGFSVSLTMRVAQSLYESGHITYMRTDSMNLSALFLNACGPVIDEKIGQGYHKRRQYHTHAKGAQEAHEAIRPTHIEKETITGTAQEKRLYSLIWKRTAASQMADAELERTTVEIGISTRGEQFTAVGEVVKFDGFLRLYRESRNEEEAAEDESALLPPLAEGERVQPQAITAQQKYTQSPIRYNEASLVHKLEELGIGRPSTYAPTISTIQQREYVVKGEKEGEMRPYILLTLKNGQLTETTEKEKVGAEKNKLLPTDVGIVVNDFLAENFPEIMDYNFTAKVEKDFDKIADGEEDWTALIHTFYDDFEPRVEATLNAKSEHRVGERNLGTDPVSGLPVSVKIGRYGPMAQLGVADADEKPRFATLKADQSIETITLDQALELFKLPRTVGDFEGAPVVVNIGRFGPYVMHNKKFASIPKGEDPLSITLERAQELIIAKREEDAQKHIKRFDENPDLEVLNGRFGPYIAYQKKNYKLPKEAAKRAKELTLEECMSIIESEKTAAPKRTTTRRKTAK